MTEREIIENISEYYPIKIFKAFNSNDVCLKAFQIIIKQLHEIYRFFEPGIFLGKFFLCYSFEEKFILPENNATYIYDKNSLVDIKANIVVLQIFKDGKIYLWENTDISSYLQSDNKLFYCYENKKEFFYANNEKIEVSNNPFGSRFAPHFQELINKFKAYSRDKIKFSSCPLFKDAWFDKNRIFFKGGGKNMPEQYMQESLTEFLKNNVRGTEVEILREHNLDASKPVDIRVHWKEANRAALIELKWLGKSKGNDGEISTKYTNSRAVEGIQQLKDYLDLSNTDTPTCITKAYLVVIDGRRKGTRKDTTDIDVKNGLHYKNIELEIPEEKQYYRHIKNFEEPIRMFCEPLCK